MKKTRNDSRIRRRKHTRKSISGTAARPRISVFRSNRYLFVQAVDDENNRVIAAIWEKTLKPVKGEVPIDRAARLGSEFGKVLVKKKVKQAVFDRGGYKYHGRIKSFADGVRDAGIKF